MNLAFLSLGSNIEPRNDFILKAIDYLKNDQEIKIVSISQIIETDPVGFSNQPKFLNAVLKIQTKHSPENLLESILSIENKIGRIRKMKWGPRKIDIDILLFNKEKVDLPFLKIPHPELSNRPFFLELIESIN